MFIFIDYIIEQKIRIIKDLDSITASTSTNFNKSDLSVIN